MLNIQIACAGFCVWESAGLTSEPAEEVVVMLCRQVGEDVFNPPPKLEAENPNEYTVTLTEHQYRKINTINTNTLCMYGKGQQVISLACRLQIRGKVSLAQCKIHHTNTSSAFRLTVLFYLRAAET